MQKLLFGSLYINFQIKFPEKIAFAKYSDETESIQHGRAIDKVFQAISFHGTYTMDGHTLKNEFSKK